jgi:hypothetical protein
MDVDAKPAADTSVAAGHPEKLHMPEKFVSVAVDASRHKTDHAHSSMA